MNTDVSTDMENGIELCAFLETAKKVFDIRISKYLRKCYKHVHYILSTHSTSVQFLSKLILIFSGSSLWDINADVMHCEEINPGFFLHITHFSTNFLVKRTKNYLQNLQLHSFAKDLVVYIEGRGRFVITSRLFPGKIKRRVTVVQ